MGVQPFVSCMGVTGVRRRGVACARASGVRNLTSTVTLAPTPFCVHLRSLTEKWRSYLWA